MSARKWTAGPWCVVGRHGFYRRIVPGWDTRVTIAALPVLHAPRIAANADLIAAAPELYEALAAVLEHIVPENWQDDEDMAVAVRQVMRAMAKARGET